MPDHCADRASIVNLFACVLAKPELVGEDNRFVTGSLQFRCLFHGWLNRLKLSVSLNQWIGIRQVFDGCFQKGYCIIISLLILWPQREIYGCFSTAAEQQACPE